MDYVIAGLLCLITFRLGYLGVHVSVNPVGNKDYARKKKIKHEIWGLASFSIALVLLQTYRTNTAYSELKEEIHKDRNAAVSLYSVEPSNRGQRLVADQQLQFNVHYMVRENTARNMRNAEQMYLADSPPTPEVTRAVKAQFKSTEAQQLNYQGQDLGVNTGKWNTVSLPMSEKQIEAIMAGTSTIYIVSTVHWVNPSGSDGHSDGCTYLQKPTERYISLTNGIWHECGT